MTAALVAMVLAQGVCVSRDTRWAPRVAIELRLPDGTPWAAVQGSDWVGAGSVVAQATFHPDGGTTLEAWHAGVRVEAVVRELPVFLRAPQDFGNGFTSAAGTALRVGRVFEDGGVELVPAPRSDVRPLLEWKPVTAGCDRVRLDGEMSTKPSEALGHEARLLDRLGGHETFILPEGTHFNVIRRARLATQIEVLLKDGSTIAGWLNERITPASSVSGVFIDGYIGCRVAQPPPRDCTNDLPLFATDGRHLGEVGVMQARTFFDVASSDGDWVTVSPRESFFGLWRGWRLVVRSDDLEKCSVLPLPAGAHSLGSGSSLQVEPRSD